MGPQRQQAAPHELLPEHASAGDGGFEGDHYRCYRSSGGGRARGLGGRGERERGGEEQGQAAREGKTAGSEKKEHVIASQLWLAAAETLRVEMSPILLVRAIFHKLVVG